MSKPIALCFVLVVTLTIVPAVAKERPTKSHVDLQLLKLLKSELPEIDECSRTMGRFAAPSFEENFQVTPVKLGKHAGMGVAVQGQYGCLCSPTGNCDFWVFRRLKQSYEEILHTHMVQVFKFLPSESHGVRDLEKSSHGSAFERGVTIFRFNGMRYLPSECYDETYLDLDANGDEVTHNPPLRKNVSCQ